MLLKVPDKLNKNPNEHSRVEKIVEQADGIGVYRVDQIYVVTYEGHEWAKQRAKLKVQRNAEGVAFFERTTKAGKKVQVLFDDEDWNSVKVQAFDLVLRRQERIQIRPLGGGIEFLSRAGCSAQTSGRKLLPRRNESGYIGVYLLANKTYRAACFVKGENRTVGRNFAAHELDEAIEIYDLVSFYQHGPGALVNRPDMISRYLEMLELDETEQRTPLPDDFTCPSHLHSTAGSLDEPIPLNLVVQIIKNKGTKNTGKTSFRKLIVDVGDGQRTLLKAYKDSDLCHIYGEESQLMRGAVAMLKNLQCSKSLEKTQLIHNKELLVLPLPSGRGKAKAAPLGGLTSDPGNRHSKPPPLPL
ncbi:uncharacterized protein PSANT_02816 [Moesziomyces antarcticus]|uniref:Uncharacterized protein n=1 Tax=Pseudozyma antarctica TaxID=84753 RepID=A0A5C3FLM6_PSEA2|nr:uncharacterized protein PSANT_02816 [Moesziomyces antarcticus]